MRDSRLIAFLAGAFAFGLGAFAPAPDYITLGPDARPLRKAFNGDRGQARLVLGLSPICVKGGMGLIPDPRVTHYWDGHGAYIGLGLGIVVAVEAELQAVGVRAPAELLPSRTGVGRRHSNE